jgi:hypothetical protein
MIIWQPKLSGISGVGTYSSANSDLPSALGAQLQRPKHEQNAFPTSAHSRSGICLQWQYIYQQTQYSSAFANVGHQV